jgi:hypothetical protein
MDERARLDPAGASAHILLFFSGRLRCRITKKSHLNFSTMVTANKKVAATAPAAAAASSSSPTGIALPLTPNWFIGKELGAGSQGAVYEIVIGGGDPKNNNNNNNRNVVVSTEWVVKVVPVATITKKKTSLAEMNAGSLSKESLLYQSLLGPKLRGTYIAKIPTASVCGPAFHNKVHGT